MRRREFVSLSLAPLIAFRPVAAMAAAGKNRVNRVAVDPRIELMSIVHLLGGYFLTTQADLTYKDAAEAYFAPHRDHPAIGMAQQLRKESFSFDRVPLTMLQLTDPPDLAWRSDLGDLRFYGLPDIARRDRFLAALRDFYRVSKFRQFFDGHGHLYGAIGAQIAPVVETNVRALESYTGASLGYWRAIPGALLHDGGFGPRLERRDGKVETYAVLGPLATSSGRADFGDEARLQDLIVHEFAHSLVNPLTADFPSEVAKYEGRFAALKDAMHKRGYDDWPTIVNEHVVRAITARIAAKRKGDAAEERVIAAQLGYGYSYVPALVARLRVYESDRKRWPTLKSFYPDLLNAFRAEAPRAPPRRTE